MDELTKVINDALAMVEQATQKYNEGKKQILSVNLEFSLVTGYPPKKARVLMEEIHPDMKQISTSYFEDRKTEFYEMQVNGVLFCTNKSKNIEEHHDSENF